MEYNSLPGTCLKAVMWIRIILVAWIRIPIRINKLNLNPHPDPHQSDKLDPDPDPHHMADDKAKMSGI
jgi:hypothetical protein